MTTYNHFEAMKAMIAETEARIEADTAWLEVSRKHLQKLCPHPPEARKVEQIHDWTFFYEKTYCGLCGLVLKS